MNTEAYFSATDWYDGWQTGVSAAHRGESPDDYTKYNYSTSEWMDGFLSGYDDVCEGDDE